MSSCLPLMFSWGKTKTRQYNLGLNCESWKEVKYGLGDERSEVRKGSSGAVGLVGLGGYQGSGEVNFVWLQPGLGQHPPCSFVHFITPWPQLLWLIEHLVGIPKRKARSEKLMRQSHRTACPGPVLESKSQPLHNQVGMLVTNLFSGI